jgi:hypothetical protein
MVTIFVNGCSK